MQEEALHAGLARWRRLALVAAGLLTLSLIALLVLVLRPHQSPAEPGEAAAEVRLRRAAEAAREVSRLRGESARVGELELDFAHAEVALLRALFTGDEAAVPPLEQALKTVRERAGRLREQMVDPDRRALLSTAAEKLWKWDHLATRAVQQRREAPSWRAELPGLLRAGDEVRQAVGALADTVGKRLADRESELGSLLPTGG